MKAFSGIVMTFLMSDRAVMATFSSTARAALVTARTVSIAVSMDRRDYIAMRRTSPTAFPSVRRTFSIATIATVMAVATADRRAAFA